MIPNKQGISSVLFSDLKGFRGPKMWKKVIQIEYTDAMLHKLQVHQAPSVNLSLDILKQVAGFKNCFIVLEGKTAGMSVSRDELNSVKACKSGGYVNIHGESIGSDWVRVSAYVAP